eukprot:TRINITY_DN82137_c0_g1_i1.p1 TRINITY_DN82137_c0_g1~~TRINITY_DN82137_c0_g1_i1.p1  ORF type:complete len:189 (-),score=25.71 TRINITY_DN82137_c0_g1_i1:139-705(-)
MPRACGGNLHQILVSFPDPGTSASSAAGAVPVRTGVRSSVSFVDFQYPAVVPRERKLASAFLTDDWLTTSSGLKYKDQSLGSGTAAAAGQKVSVHYTGKLQDGTIFDSSRNRGTPISFELGAGQVIKGWDEGIAGMKVGGKRQLHIPADLAYGASGAGPIPPGATLTFDTELVDVKPPDYETATHSFL